MLTVAELRLLEPDPRTGVDFGALTSFSTVGGVAKRGEEAAVALGPAGAEAPEDDADWEELVELDSMERLFFSLATTLAALALPGVWWADSDPAPGAVASVAVAVDALGSLAAGGIVGVGR